MPANATTAVATERKDLGQGEKRSDADLTHNLQYAARHDGAKELGKWPVVKSGELLSFVTSGSRGWARYYAESGALFLRIGNLDHDSISLDMRDLQRVAPPAGAEGTRTKVQPSDILISITADVGMVGLVPSTLGEAYINQHVALVRPLPTVHPSYLAWCLTSPQAQRQFLKLQRGATKVGLGLDDIRAVDVPLPPIAQQQRIVAEIEKQFTRLEVGVIALRRVQANLKRYRAAVLKAACEGRLVEGDRSSWETERLGQLVTIRYGKMLPKKEFSTSGFPVFGANGIIGYYTRYLYEAEQVLISCRGAYSGKLNLSPPKCYITNNSLVLEMPEPSRIEKRFLFYVLQAADKSKLVSGSAQPQVTINNADVLDVLVPPLAEQTRIVAEVERRLSMVEELEAVVSANLQRARRLRQSILHQAFQDGL